jgi:threonylcarbamoyladenosine tRNA methylthiotransferase MtaB
LKRVAFHTLGCKLNFAESSDLARQFVLNGYCQVDFHDLADVYVINTCSVTQIAEKKCRNAIRQAANLNANAIIAVIGCFAQLRPEQIEQVEGVDIILGNANKHKLFEYIEQQNDIKAIDCEDRRHYISDINKVKDISLSYSSEDRTRCFLKVQDGCDYFCSYCTIPYARGRSRSATIADVLEVVKKISDEGKKEIILTGINIGDFGKHNGETFFELMKALDRETDIERYRISSIEPNLLTEEMIDFVSVSRAFLPHFHIPLQAGTDTILKSMKRKYDTALFAQRINYIHSKMPYAFIAADVIVGFVGETDSEFEQTTAFINGLQPLSALHVFTYSERPNTLAINFDNKVPVQIRKQRSLILQEISQDKKHRFYNQNTNSQRKVLWESDNENGLMYGFTDNYIRVCKPYNIQFANQIEEVKLCNLDTDKLHFRL